MRIRDLHPWNVTLSEAAAIQTKLSSRVILEDAFDKIATVCGVGIACKGSPEKIVVAATLFSFPDLKLITKQAISGKITFPYKSGYFAFCVGPAVLKLFQQIQRPSLIIFPGKGAVHPRGLGLASHLGLWLDLPTLACSRRPIAAAYTEPPYKAGSFTPLSGEFSKLGAVLRTQDNIKPIFVSIGHKMSLSTAIEIALGCCTKYRLPEPLRSALILARQG